VGNAVGGSEGMVRWSLTQAVRFRRIPRSSSVGKMNGLDKKTAEAVCALTMFPGRRW
jgi:hypothetical protein